MLSVNNLHVNVTAGKGAFYHTFDIAQTVYHNTSAIGHGSNEYICESNAIYEQFNLALPETLPHSKVLLACTSEFRKYPPHMFSVIWTLALFYQYNTLLIKWVNQIYYQLKYFQIQLSDSL